MSSFTVINILNNYPRLYTAKSLHGALDVVTYLTVYHETI